MYSFFCCQIASVELPHDGVRVPRVALTQTGGGAVLYFLIGRPLRREGRAAIHMTVARLCHEQAAVRSTQTREQRRGEIFSY